MNCKNCKDCDKHGTCEVEDVEFGPGNPMPPADSYQDRETMGTVLSEKEVTAAALAAAKQMVYEKVVLGATQYYKTEFQNGSITKRDFNEKITRVMGIAYQLGVARLDTYAMMCEELLHEIPHKAN